MSGTWREVLIEVEPRGKAFRIGLEEGATADDVIHAIQGRCKEEGVDVDRWAREQVGRDFQFVLMRRSQGNSILAPSLQLAGISPHIIEGEEFVFGTQPVVGGLPTPIFNRRIDHLVEAFFEESVADLYRREGARDLPF